MRALFVGAAVAAAGLVVAGCGQSEKQQDGNVAAAKYRPPTVTSRADFGGQIERRFHRMDKNGDDKLQTDELPERMQRVVGRYDKSGDGTLDSDEWGALMLERFDKQDANKDGNVTSEERAKLREERQARQAARGGE